MSASVCYKCNRPGHFARECQDGGGGGGGGGRHHGGGGRGDFRRGNREKCYKCNQQGHFARECKEDADRCYRCNGLYLYNLIVFKKNSILNRKQSSKRKKN